MASSKSGDSYISDFIDPVSNSASVRGKKRSFEAAFVGPSSCVCNNKSIVDDGRLGDLSPDSESELEVDDFSHEDAYSKTWRLCWNTRCSQTIQKMKMVISRLRKRTTWASSPGIWSPSLITTPTVTSLVFWMTSRISKIQKVQHSFCRILCGMVVLRNKTRYKHFFTNIRH